MELQILNLLPAKLTGGQLETADTSGVWSIDTDENVIFLCTKEADSIGLLLVTPQNNYYITDTQLDTVFIISQLSALCEQVSAIGNNSSYTTAAQGIIFGPLPSLQSIAGQVDAIKQALDDYKVT